MDDDTGGLLVVAIVLLAIIGLAAQGGMGRSGVVDGRQWTENWEGQCVVQGARDGDTLICNDSTLFRLNLVDAPEISYEHVGRVSKAALLHFAPVGTRMRIELDQTANDEYGRVLGYVYTSDGFMLNERLVGLGYGVAWPHNENTLYQERIRRAHDYAKANEEGLWQNPVFRCFAERKQPDECNSLGKQ